MTALPHRARPTGGRLGDRAAVGQTEGALPVECAMPRDLRIVSCRPSALATGALRSRIQVSISDETPTSTSAREPRAGNQVGEQRGDVRRALQKVDQAHHHGVDLARRAADEARQTDRPRRRRAGIVDVAVHRRQVHTPGRRAWAARRGCAAGPCVTQRSRSRPIERMLRTILRRRLLEPKQSARSPRRQAASDEVRGEARLAGAGAAGDRMLLPR